MFIEFNINNGFFVADHSVEECEQMHSFFKQEFNARKQKQLVDHNPNVDGAGGKEEGIAKARSILRKLKAKIPFNKISALSHRYTDLLDEKVTQKVVGKVYEKIGRETKTGGMSPRASGKKLE